MELKLDEGVQFGLGLFETIAVEQGRPLLLKAHLERLGRSAEELAIGRTVTERQVREFLTGQACTHHALKVMVSRENLLFTLRPNPYTKARYERGFQLKYSSVYRNETSPLTRHKTMNYGDCILEKRRATTVGADDLVFCNSRGELCETTTANLFFAKGGRLYTPPVSCGLLPGVMRRYVIEHFPVTEAVLTPEDVGEMEECFVTNSLMGVMAVRSLGAVDFSSHDIAEICMAQYCREMGITIQ